MWNFVAFSLALYRMQLFASHTTLVFFGIPGFGKKVSELLCCTTGNHTTLDHLLLVQQLQYETVSAYTNMFNKKAMKVPNLSVGEHIQAYKHGLRSLSLTKVLATKHLDTVDALLEQYMNSSNGKSVSKVNGITWEKSSLLGAVSTVYMG